MTAWLAAAGITVAVKILADELLDWFPWLAERVVERAAGRMPPQLSERYREEWLGELGAVPGRGVSKLVFALRVLLRAGSTAGALEGFDLPISARLTQRGVDITLALALLLVVLPLFALVVLAIKIDSRGPVIFRQTRAGQGGRPFQIVKFRTMMADADAVLPPLILNVALSDPMFKLRADPRVTRLGRFLRRTSLDELPQLLNVLRGEMSLVGPQPEPLELVEHYGPEHQFRLKVKPGMTGPWHKYGRGELTFEEQLALEREYVENLSLARNLKILLMTLPAVLGRRK